MYINLYQQVRIVFDDRSYYQSVTLIQNVPIIMEMSSQLIYRRPDYQGFSEIKFEITTLKLANSKINHKTTHLLISIHQYLNTINLNTQNNIIVQ